MSSRQQKRKRSDAENKDPQRRRKGNARGGSKNRKKTVRDLDEECNIDKGTHDKADEKVQSRAKSVLEELSGPPADRQDDEISEEDNDDSSVEEVADGKLDRSASNFERQGAVIDIRNGTRPPSRDQPLVDIGRGHEAGTAGGCIVVNNGRPPSRDQTIVDGGRRNHVGTGWSVNHGGPPSRGHPTGGNDRVGDHVGGGYSIVTNGQHPPAAIGTRLVQARQHEGLDAGPAHVTSSPKKQRHMSYRTARTATMKSTRERIQVLVKTVIFRAVKFITCDEHMEKVMEVVIAQEKPIDAHQFVRMYKTIVTGALNTKRSTCEQSASEAVMKLLKIKDHKDEVEPPPYSFQVLCKLRQSQTREEKEAFLWFVGDFLQTVCGKRAWGSKKYRSTISDATSSDTGNAIVTVSDEAFALLLYDAYIDKWIKRYHEDRRGEPRTPRMVGKYTKNEDAPSEYGGWSEEGIEMFNMLGGIVDDDRKSRNARDAEEWVLESLREQVGGGAQMRNNREMDPSALQRAVERANRPKINAFIEL